MLKVSLSLPRLLSKLKQKKKIQKCQLFPITTIFPFVVFLSFFFDLYRFFLFYGNAIIYSLSSLLISHCWLNCKSANECYIKYTK